MPCQFVTKQLQLYCIVDVFRHIWNDTLRIRARRIVYASLRIATMYWCQRWSVFVNIGAIRYETRKVEFVIIVTKYVASTIDGQTIFVKMGTHCDENRKSIRVAREKSAHNFFSHELIVILVISAINLYICCRSLCFDVQGLGCRRKLRYQSQI